MEMPPIQLPEKPLKIKGMFDNSIKMMTFLVILMPFLALGMFWFSYKLGENIYSDYQISQDYRVLSEASISGQCKARKGFISDCDVTIHNGGQTWERSFAFFDVSGDDYVVQAIASNQNPNQVTLDLAVEKIGNRSILAAIIFLLALVLAWAAFYLPLVALPNYRKMFRGLNEDSAYPWRLEIIEADAKKGKPLCFYPVLDGKARKIAFVCNKTVPWVISSDKKTAKIFAFAPKNGGQAVPFDKELKHIVGLSKVEKQALLDSLYEALKYSQQTAGDEKPQV